MQEIVALSSKMDRIERQIEQIAKPDQLQHHYLLKKFDSRSKHRAMMTMFKASLMQKGFNVL